MAAASPPEEVEPTDDDVFEIDDFTVVSPLETLVSAFELAIHEMCLEGARPVYDLHKLSKQWRLETAERQIAYESNTFLLKWFHPSEEFIVQESNEKQSRDKNKSHYAAVAHQIASHSTDFTSRNNITAMYGVVEYLTLCGLHSENDKIASQEQKDFVLSAVRIALNNTNCELPFLIQCGNADSELFFGSVETRNQSMEFLPTHLYQLSPRHSNCSGLLGLLREKINTKISPIDLEEVRLSIRFEYAFKEPYRQRQTFRGDEKKLHRECKDCRDQLALSLVCRWPCQPETSIHENESFSNVEPVNSINWELFADFHPEYQAYCHRLKLFIYKSQSEASPFITELYTPPPLEVEAAEDRISEEKRKEKLLNNSDYKNLLGGDVLSVVEADDRRFPAWMRPSFMDPSTATDPLLAAALEELRYSKAAPLLSVAARLAVQVSHVVEDEADIALKWTAFTKLLRWHWDNNVPLPGMEDVETPNMATCLFNQKLEMLQCAIGSRKQRHADLNNVQTFGHDEFFDAMEDQERKEPRDSKVPAGRKTPFGAATLYHHPDVPLYVPETQAICPMTEDMVAAHAEHISSLKEGKERTEAQMGLLKSDMQAFKAANPRCHLIDFIRWHSPKDWNEEKGELSERMSVSGNAWERCWEDAAPLAAVYQQSHFNEANIAEGILSMFESATVAQVCEWLLPLLFHITTVQMLFEDEHVRSEGDVKTMCTLVARATRDSHDPARASYYQALAKLRKYERLAHFHSHLWKTFWRQQFLRKAREESEIRELVKALIVESDAERSATAMFRDGVPLKGAANHFLGDIIKGDFQGQNGLLSKNQLPHRKSYVLYWNVPFPGNNSRLQPHRIFANIEYENNRICSVFTSDAIFF